MARNLSEAEKSIIGEIYSSTEAYDNLVTLCDEFGGRLNGSPGNKAAAEFLLGKFKEYGFKNPHLEPFKCPTYKDASSSLEILSPLGREVPCLTLPMTPSGNIEGELVYVGEGEDLEKQKGKLAGKVVIALNRISPTKIKESGAAGYIWMHPFPAMGPPTGVYRSKIPAVSVKHEDGMMLRRLVERKGKVKARLSAKCTQIETTSWNVCGEVPGNGASDEFIMFGGHYDGHEIAQAAFDCGAPCTISTEVGRVLSTVSDSLDRNVRVVLFSSEEFGCQGSQDYSVKHAEDMKKMRFTYQLDCTAGPGQQYVTTAFWPELEPFYAKLAEDLNMCIPHEQRMGPGDTRAFMALGIPTGCILDYRAPTSLSILETYRHTYFDTVDKIDFGHMREATIIGAVSGYRMLNAKKWPKHRTPEEMKKLKIGAE
jgi:hypothetical protein